MTHFLDEEKPPRWFVFFMAVVITTAVMMALFSCSPAAKLRMAERLTNEAIAAGAVVKADTVYTERVIPGKEIRVEVPVEKLVRYDTIIYQKGEPTKVPVFRWAKKDTTINRPDATITIKWGKGGLMSLDVKVKPDTVEVPVTVQKSIVCPPADHTWRTVALVLACLVVVLFLVKR